MIVWGKFLQLDNEKSLMNSYVNISHLLKVNFFLKQKLPIIIPHEACKSFKRLLNSNDTIHLKVPKGASEKADISCFVTPFKIV